MTYAIGRPHGPHPGRIPVFAAPGVVAVALGLFLGLMGLRVSPVTATEGLDAARQASARIVVGQGGGSGVVISDRHILTAAHVVGSASRGTAWVAEGERGVPFTVAARDRKRDLALLLAQRAIGVEPADWADSKSAKVGDSVWVVGFPAGVRRVSAVEGVVSVVDQELDDGQRYLQTSAPVNPGNSGGPLVSKEGLLLGIVVVRGEATPDGRRLEGMGFAVPGDDARRFVHRATGVDPGVGLPGGGGGGGAGAQRQGGGTPGQPEADTEGGSGSPGRSKGWYWERRRREQAGVALAWGALVLLVLGGGAAAAAMYARRSGNAARARGVGGPGDRLSIAFDDEASLDLLESDSDAPDLEGALDYEIEPPDLETDDLI